MGVPIQNEIFTPEQKELRWGSFKNKDPESMFDLFTKPLVSEMTVFDHMKQVGDSAGVFAEFMSKATFIISTPRLLDQVVQLIDKINMNDRDTKGDLYEYMLSKIAEAGTNGQFRTPRHIIRMMVEITQPKQDDVICDPSAGTAGFLVSAGQYIYDKHQDWFNNQEFRNHFNNTMFNGIEFETGVDLANEAKALLPENLNLLQASLRWLLDQPAVSTIISGASSAQQVISNAQVSDLPPLSSALHQSLNTFYQEKVKQHIRGGI